MEGLQYKENLTVISGGYPGEQIGSDGIIQNWTDVPVATSSNTVSYWYRDSDTADNANSSRVVIRITDNYSIVKNEDRSFTVTVSSTIDSIVRDDVRGNPGSNTRNIFVRRNKDSAIIWSKRNDDISTAHTIATNINLGTSSFTLKPDGGINDHGTAYIRNNLSGYDSLTPPDSKIDEFWIGVNFRNTLPPDYVPGATYRNGTWYSHNRSGGTATLCDGDSWDQMRTVNGAVEQDSPPYILHDDEEWYNQRKVGQNG